MAKAVTLKNNNNEEVYPVTNRLGGFCGIMKILIWRMLYLS